MPALLIRHQGVNVEQWYPAFLTHRDVRRAHGALHEMVFHDAHNSNDLWVLISWDDLYRAQLFVRSEDFQDQLDQSGITVVPEIRFLEVLTHNEVLPQSISTEGGDSPPADGHPT